MQQKQKAEASQSQTQTWDKRARPLKHRMKEELLLVKRREMESA